MPCRSPLDAAARHVAAVPESDLGTGRRGALPGLRGQTIALTADVGIGALAAICAARARLAGSLTRRSTDVTSSCVSGSRSAADPHGAPAHAQGSEPPTRTNHAGVPWIPGPIWQCQPPLSPPGGPPPTPLCAPVSPALPFARPADSACARARGAVATAGTAGIAPRCRQHRWQRRRCRSRHRRWQHRRRCHSRHLRRRSRHFRWHRPRCRQHRL